jgi:hypothetical protein
VYKDIELVEENLQDMRKTRPHSVLIISHDIVGARMAGPGIRYYHLARVLSKEFETHLVVPSDVVPNVPSKNLCIEQYTRRDWRSIALYIADAEIIILPSDIASDFPQIAGSSAYLVIDGYDPLLAEWLALNQDKTSGDEMARWRSRMQELVQQYLIGDFYICASERQRDWWLGLLEANGRVNPHTFSEDPSLRKLIDVVPYGLPNSAPHSTNPAIKGVWSGIGPDDKVILWGGGLWPWLDPLTAIRAIEKVWQQRQDVRLIFPGTKHPNPWMGETPTHTESARALAREKGLLGKAVFFGDWVPYEDWPNVLLESDLALSLHYDTLETRLAFRSRLLDYIWAGLPTVATQGDATSDLVATYGLGAVVDFEDVDDVAGAIVQLLNQPRGQFQVKFAEARQQLAWEVVAQPLIEFCRHPRRAPDKVTLGDELGNPFYIKKQQQLIVERDRWRELVQQYQQGRFMRLMRWMHRMRRRVQGER